MKPVTDEQIRQRMGFWDWMHLFFFGYVEITAEDGRVVYVVSPDVW